MSEIERLRGLLAEGTPGPWIRPWASLNVHWMGGDDVLKSQINIDCAVAAVNALPALLDVAEAVRRMTAVQLADGCGTCGGTGIAWDWPDVTALRADLARLDGAA